MIQSVDEQRKAAARIFSVQPLSIMLQELTNALTGFVILCVLAQFLLPPSDAFRDSEFLCLALICLFCYCLPNVYRAMVIFTLAYGGTWFIFPSHIRKEPVTFCLFLIVFLGILRSRSIRFDESVQVDDEGIEYNWYQGLRLMRHGLDWNEIGTVKMVNRPWLLMPTLLIYEREFPASVKQIPLCLEDRAGFIAAVREFAPPDNPLRLFLEREVNVKNRVESCL